MRVVLGQLGDFIIYKSCCDDFLNNGVDGVTRFSVIFVIDFTSDLKNSDVIVVVAIVGVVYHPLGRDPFACISIMVRTVNLIISVI